MSSANGESTSLEGLVEEFLGRRRAGEGLSPAAFAAQHPEQGPSLLEALETAELLAALGSALQPPSHDRAAEAPLPGVSLGRYRLLRELGRGGMGVVWEALEEPLDRRVALKFLPPGLLGSPKSRARFQREAELTARLSHPCIGSILTVDLEGPQPFIAMALIEGESLASHIARARGSDRPLSLGLAGAAGSDPRALAGWFARVARALEHAHARGVIHRDLKPGNLMVTAQGEPVLVDFGLARDSESQGASLTLTDETAGTPSYLAPELVGGRQARPDAQTDVYALGVTLFEALTLARPYEAPTREALYREILSATQPRVRERRPDLPRDLATVVQTAFERDRRHRYASAAALAADLEAVAHDRPVAARPVGSLGRALRWARREPRQAALLAVLAASLLVAALAVGAFAASRDAARTGEAVARERRLEQALSLGFSLMADRDFDGAEAAFASALAVQPASLEALAGRALVSLTAERPEQALARLADAPPLPVFERLRAMARGEAVADEPDAFASASAVELFIEGERLFAEAERLPPSGAGPRARRALAYFEEALRRAPSARSLYHVRFANAAQVAGDLAAARSAARALLVLWPEAQRELFVAGAALSELDPRGSRELLERAHALDPSHLGTLRSLGIARLLTQDPRGAEQAIRAELELAPDNPSALNNLGLALVDLGRLEEARQTYRRAIELDPRKPTAWTNLADLEALVQDHAAAERALARAIELDPDDSHQRLNWAVALRRVGRHADAVEQLRWLLGRGEELAAAWWGLAVSQRELGDRREALGSAERALELLPDEPRLLELRRLLLAELGE